MDERKFFMLNVTLDSHTLIAFSLLTMTDTHFPSHKMYYGNLLTRTLICHYLTTGKHVTPVTNELRLGSQQFRQVNS